MGLRYHPLQRRAVFFACLVIALLMLFLTPGSISEEVVFSIEPALPESESGEEVILDFPADADTLAYGYIQSVLPKKPVLRVSRPSGLMLPEPSRSL